MARYRIVGRVVENKDLLGYVILNENIRKATLVTNEQMTALFQKTDFVNAELVNGTVKCTENAVDRLPKFTRDLKPVEKKPSIFVLARLVKNGEAIGFRVINSNDCITNGDVKEYNISYEEFVKMLLSGTKVVNAKLVNGKTVQAIRGNFEEVVIEEKKPEKPKPKKEDKKIAAKKYRNKQHLNKILACAKMKIDEDRTFYRVAYNSYGDGKTIKDNLNIVMNEVYAKNKDKLGEHDYANIMKIYDILMKAVPDGIYSLIAMNERYEILLFAFHTYLYDVYDWSLPDLQEYSKKRDYCVKNRIGSKKLEFSYDRLTKEQKKEANRNLKIYWQYKPHTLFDSELDVNAFGITFDMAEQGNLLSNITYVSNSNHRRARYEPLKENYPEFLEDSVCIGDYLLPYNIIQSILWVAKNKDKYSKEQIQGFMNKIEVKLAVLALYNPAKAEMVKNICTYDGEDVKNWYFLPDFDYSSKAKLDRNDADKAVFYRSAGFLVYSPDKITQFEELHLNKTKYVNVRNAKVDLDKYLAKLGLQVAPLLSNKSTDIMGALKSLYIIPRI